MTAPNTKPTQDAGELVDKMVAVAQAWMKENQVSRYRCLSWAGMREAAEGEYVAYPHLFVAIQEIDQLKAECQRLREEAASVIPDRCPITGLPFFMTIQDEDGRMVPTYGGPYDSYTIPEIEGDSKTPLHEREFTRRRYDHDAGGWIDGCEVVGQRLIEDDQLLKFDDELEALRAQLATAQADTGRLDHVQRMLSVKAVSALNDCGAINTPRAKEKTLRAEIDAALPAPPVPASEQVEPTPDAAVDPGEGWRLLDHEKDRKQEGDEAFDSGYVQWVVSSLPEGHEFPMGVTYRRRITAQEGRQG